MRLVREYKSIQTTPTDIELPDFMVLSGPNGSGKTHLLEALANGCLNVGIDRNKARDSNSRPIDSGLIRHFPFGSFGATGGQIRNPFGPNPFDPRTTRDPESKRLGQAEAMLHSFHADEPISTKRGKVRATSQTLRDILRNEDVLSEREIASVEHAAKCSIHEILPSDIVHLLPPFGRLSDPFSTSVSELFAGYAARLKLNRFHWWEKQEGYVQENRAWSDDDFERIFGPPPWDVVNSALEVIDLPYRFEGLTPGQVPSPYVAQLRSLDGDLHLKVADLSTGEKTLMAIALALYATTDDIHPAEAPELLLLDEADASLHPSMKPSLLRVLQHVLVERLGVKVILTTHSPTTVALAPAESLYVIERGADPRLFQTSRDDCLNRLTVGLPTLSITTENRRQVIVEARTDASIYTTIYQAIRPELQSNLSLEFIAAGNDRDGGDTEVLRMVEEFRSTGNTSIYGLVDRDDRTSSPEYVHFSTLCYSIENFVLMPWAVGLLLCREGRLSEIPGAPRELGPFFGIRGGDLQDLSDFVVSLLPADSADTGSSSVALRDGTTLSLPTWWLQTNGHQLQAMLMNRIAQLALAKGRPLEVIATRVYAELPGIIPLAMERLFTQICEAGERP